jgi:hypothetical protein
MTGAKEEEGPGMKRPFTCLLLLVMIPQQVWAKKIDALGPVFEGKGKETRAYLTAEKKGLVLTALSSRKTLLLDKGPVAWAFFEPSARVIWYGKPHGKEGDEIYVYDLLEEIPSPARVFGQPIGYGLIVRAGELEYTANAEEPFYLAIRIKIAEKSLSVESVDGVYRSLYGDSPPGEVFDPKKLNSLLKSFNGKGLAPLRKRHFARDIPRWIKRADGSRRVRVSAVYAKEHCSDDEKACGLASDFGDTGYWHVMTSHDCGDGCFTSYHLYDPRTQRFAPLSAPLKWKKNLADLADDGESQTTLFFDGSGKFYGMEDKLCSIETGCRRLAGKIGGFLPLTFIRGHYPAKK